ncbi:MAG: hypothetical protein Q9M97_01445 [Candidatus Gracilibacteria bacterium]|nr:hypothetical protein [Candidatus Gracilibacteria bacterium]
MRKSSKVVLVLTFILTSFLLGIYLSDKVKEIYVNKILKTQNSLDKNISRIGIFEMKKT